MRETVGLRKIEGYARSTTAAACVCALCSMAVSSTQPGHVVQCVRGACCALCVWRGHTPQRTILSWLTARVGIKKKQHTEQPRRHAAVIDKAHGGVIDVASAPCQPSAAHGHMTLPAFAAASPHGRCLDIAAWCCANHLPCEPPYFSLLLYAVRTYVT